MLSIQRLVKMLFLIMLIISEYPRRYFRSEAARICGADGP
ncbi:hypothetical protein NOR51B_1296 [Luminiphilus syltensis NOR5-1B]|uniref:Uncharacterized protein n=1 Tax=Luminiphilus syltensis NOR5-1B TaxID=565045 RepID=B8KV64_9GAMM|nr:hypothetical protein NOR51B_1296 [Luminiphilus syltensis NOR5-1B]